MRTTLRAAAAAPTAVDRLHPSLAFKARLGVARARVSWARTCFALDSTMLLAAIAATELGGRASGAASVSPITSVGFALIALLMFQSRGLYAPRLILDTLDDAKDALIQITIAAAVTLAADVATNVGGTAVDSDPVSGMLRLWAFAGVYVVGGRVALYWSQAKARRSGDIVNPTLIVGTGRIGQLAARRLLEHRELGLLPVGFVATGARAERATDRELPIPVVGATDEIERLSDQYDITQVVVNCAEGVVSSDLMPLVNRCEDLGIAVAFIPGAHEKITKRLRVEHIGGLPLITAHATDPKSIQFTIKYAVDRAIAAVLVLLASPVLIACMLAVWATMGRPIFFRQQRVGLDGREFGMLKFRSMKGSPTTGGEADAAWAAAQLGGADGSGPVKAEDRRTPVGAFLRRSSLDELPQLINVLVGDMSLVGPRPERTSYVQMFEKSIYRYDDRHRVKAGITGWAQVNGLRGKTSLDDRVEWDNYYIENWSLWLDFKIMLLTVLAVFRFFKKGE